MDCDPAQPKNVYLELRDDGHLDLGGWAGLTAAGSGRRARQVVAPLLVKQRLDVCRRRRQADGRCEATRIRRLPRARLCVHGACGLAAGGCAGLGAVSAHGIGATR